MKHKPDTKIESIYKRLSYLRDFQRNSTKKIKDHEKRITILENKIKDLERSK